MLDEHPRSRRIGIHAAGIIVHFTVDIIILVPVLDITCIARGQSSF
ncbi:hypothetical protein GF325_02405 [Candidatus Bathyarchaeota archaeon]|nr:hypothetical protein [Candidatus Bathyarchaeota archaeon]